MSWAEIFGQIGFHCDFFCLFARSSLNARVFQLSTNDEKSDLFCSESFSIENTETQNYGFLTLASAIYVH